jgi:hypothetical protein
MQVRPRGGKRGPGEKLEKVSVSVAGFDVDFGLDFRGKPTSIDSPLLQS